MNDPNISKSPEFASELDHHLGREIADLTPPNRAEKRRRARALKRMMLQPTAGVKLLHHPMIESVWMEYGLKQVIKRRAAEKAAKAARRVNQGGKKGATGAKSAGAFKTPRQAALGRKVQA